MRNLFDTHSGSMPTASHKGARRAGALAIAALIVAAVVALVVAGCPDDTGDTTPTVTKYTCENGTAKSGTPGTPGAEACGGHR